MEEVEDVLLDPWCDERNPRTLDFEAISAAAYRIRDGVVRTPCDVIKHKQFGFFELFLSHFIRNPTCPRRAACRST